MQDSEKCGDCVYYRDVRNRQKANGFTHLTGVCIYEVFQADTFEDLAKAALVEADPTEEPCQDFKGDK